MGQVMDFRFIVVEPALSTFFRAETKYVCVPKLTYLMERIVTFQQSRFKSFGLLYWRMEQRVTNKSRLLNVASLTAGNVGVIAVIC